MFELHLCSALPAATDVANVADSDHGHTAQPVDQSTPDQRLTGELVSIGHSLKFMGLETIT